MSLGGIAKAVARPALKNQIAIIALRRIWMTRATASWAIQVAQAPPLLLVQSSPLARAVGNVDCDAIKHRLPEDARRFPNVSRQWLDKLRVIPGFPHPKWLDQPLDTPALGSQNWAVLRSLAKSLTSCGLNGNPTAKH